MKQVDEMPTSGRFAVVWQGVDCLICGEILKWDDCGSLIAIMPDGYHEEVDADFYVKLEAKYFIAD
jgi:hypothetical protein